ncbi:MAG: tetratricopeptide repeat protein [Thermoanaerobaculia bacterium]|nr:tetratricopeptide repeat protein [Thermoanaerobaculia bacterium]
MKVKFLCLSLLYVLAQSAPAQSGNIEKELAQARQLAASGQYAGAEAQYERILVQQPNNLEALTGAGYNYSWSKQYDKARLKFEEALALDPNATEALVGQGYNYAWSGNYRLAKRAFEKLKLSQPNSVEAFKGLAYVHLWAGDGAAAITYFLDLTQKFPGETEYRIALAQAYLSRYEVKKARIVLRSALQIDSANRIANDLLKSTYSAAAPLEFDVWAGYSSTEGETKFSLRTLQLSGQVGRRLRMYLKYDNSLTADLAALVRTNQEAQALSVGAVSAWDKRFTTRLEYGARLLPDNVNQQIFSGEQVCFLANGMSVKAGGFYGLSNKGPNEWLAYGGFRAPLTRWYAVEPYYFLSRVENAPRTENRFMLNNQLRTPGGYELNLGLMYGKAGITPADSKDNKIIGSYITAILPFSQLVWGQFSLRWERTPFADLTVAAAGIKLRLEK